MGAATAASDQFMPGAETRRERETEIPGGVRDKEKDTETERHMQERLSGEAKIKMGNAEANTGELGAERRSKFERHKETQS